MSPRAQSRGLDCARGDNYSKSLKKDDDKMQALLWSYEIVTSDKLAPIEHQSYDELKGKLASYLNNLVVNDFNKLISILYRIDIAQEKAMAALAENSQKESAGETLARLIIERQLEKVITRRQYRKY
ncbi:MAG: hypothetical protein ACTIJ9_06445 [Aequorivita sp.]